jgi:hypothetical protein
VLIQETLESFFSGVAEEQQLCSEHWTKLRILDPSSRATLIIQFPRIQGSQVGTLFAARA